MFTGWKNFILTGSNGQIIDSSSVVFDSRDYQVTDSDILLPSSSTASPHMGPIRAEKSYKMGESSSSSAQILKKRRKFTPKDTGSNASTLPGVQKLKSSLRQTRRLLAKVSLSYNTT